jgi:hypothetical protein
MTPFASMVSFGSAAKDDSVAHPMTSKLHVTREQSLLENFIGIIVGLHADHFLFGEGELSSTVPGFSALLDVRYEGKYVMK